MQCNTTVVFKCAIIVRFSSSGASFASDGRAYVPHRDRSPPRDSVTRDRRARGLALHAVVCSRLETAPTPLPSVRHRAPAWGAGAELSWAWVGGRRGGMVPVRSAVHTTQRTADSTANLPWQLQACSLSSRAAAKREPNPEYVQTIPVVVVLLPSRRKHARAWHRQAVHESFVTREIGSDSACFQFSTTLVCLVVAAAALSCRVPGCYSVCRRRGHNGRSAWHSKNLALNRCELGW